MSKIVMTVSTRDESRMSSISMLKMGSVLDEKVQLNPRESGAFIASTSEDVKINSEAVSKCAKLILESITEGKFQETDWLAQDLHPKSRDRAAVDWCFFVDTINFSFWTPSANDKFRVTYNGKTWTGYFAACACVNRALDEGIPLTDPKYYADISEDDLKSILIDDNGTTMPLIKLRKKALHDAGKILLEKFSGSFYSVVELAEYSAMKLLNLIVENFDSYRDTAVYNGREVCLYKRAQILVADVWRSLDSKGLCDFKDIDEITMFADYRVPQILAFLGVLEYSENLLKRLKSEELFQSGEKMEVEIRGCTIHACEVIVKEIRDLSDKNSEFFNLKVPLNAITVDNFLWCYRRERAVEVEEKVPYHRIRTIYY